MTSWFARNRRSSSCSWQDQPQQQQPLLWKPTTTGSLSSQSHRVVPPLAAIHPNHHHSIEMSQLSENSSVVSNNQSNSSKSSGHLVGDNLGQESLSSFSYTSTGGIASHRLTTRTRNNDHLLWKPSISHPNHTPYYRTPNLSAAPSRVSPTNASTRSAMAATAAERTPAPVLDTNALSKQVFAVVQAKLETFLQRKLQEISKHAVQLQEQTQNQIQAYAEQSSQASMARVEKESLRLEQNQRAFYRRMVSSEEEHQERCAVIANQLAHVDERLKDAEAKTDRVEQQTGKLHALYTKVSSFIKAAEQRIVSMKESLLEQHPSNDKKSESSSKKLHPSNTGGEKIQYRTRSSSSLTPVTQRDDGSNIIQNNTLGVRSNTRATGSLRSVCSAKSKNNVVDTVPENTSRNNHEILPRPCTSPLTFKSCVTPCDKENNLFSAMVMKTPDRSSGRSHCGKNNKKRSISTALESQDLNVGTTTRRGFTSKNTTTKEEIYEEKDDVLLVSCPKKMRKQRFGGRFSGGIPLSSSGQKKQAPLSKKKRVTNTIYDDFGDDDDFKFSMFP